MITHFLGQAAIARQSALAARAWEDFGSSIAEELNVIIVIMCYSVTQIFCTASSRGRVDKLLPWCELTHPFMCDDVGPSVYP